MKRKTPNYSHLQMILADLERIEFAAQAAIRRVENQPPLPLNRKQLKALNNTLRTLDGLNLYDLGDELRVAFNVEDPRNYGR